MTNSLRASASNGNADAPSTGVDKDAQYGRFQASEDWKANLYRKLAHKALDIGDDDVGDINVGLKGNELLAILEHLKGQQTPAQQPIQPQTTTAVQPATESTFATWAKRLAIPLAALLGIGGKMAWDKAREPEQPAAVQPAAPGIDRYSDLEVTTGPHSPTEEPRP